MPHAVTSIRIQGFRSLRDVTLEPGRITVLIGANGVGKSNVLSALRMIPLIRTKALRLFVGDAGGASSILHYGPSRTPEMSVRLEFQQDRGHNAYLVRLGHAADDSFTFRDEQVQYRAATASTFREYSLGVGHSESKIEDAAHDPDNVTARAVRWLLSRMTFFHFHDTSPTSPLRRLGRQEDDRFLRSDGSNLASYLHALRRGESEAYRAAWLRITSLVQRVAPFIETLDPVLVSPDAPERSMVRLDWIDDRGERFGVHQLSDGTLRAIALITALAQPVDNLPAFMAIDEPELGLHPAAIALLAGLVRSTSAHTQVVLGTQSPALLDQFDPADVVVVDRKTGETSLRRLPVAELESWLEDYSLSEIWNKNIFGARP